MSCSESRMPNREPDREIELICAIIRNGYRLGLSSRNKLTPRERYEFAVRLEEICAIAEWMSRYVEYREAQGAVTEMSVGGKRTVRKSKG